MARSAVFLSIGGTHEGNYTITHGSSFVHRATCTADRGAAMTANISNLNIC